MSRLRKRAPARGLAALLAALSLLLAGCGDDAEDSATAEATGIRMVFFNFGSGFTYTAAIERGARARAAELGVELDILDAQVDPAKQVRQMQDAITSGRYVGGFVLPIAQDLLCDLATNVAPAKNFMVVVTNAPVCGRVANEGEQTWAPGTLAFASAGQEISNFTSWGEAIRDDNPGKQKVILLVGPETTGQSQNAKAALDAIEKKHPQFDVVRTVYTDFSRQDAVAKMQAALAAHPDATVVASIYSELTKGTIQVLADRGGKNVRVYDVGADSSVLSLIGNGQVRMTTPYYPRTLGETAVQAIYDARVGRTPLPRFYANSGRATPAMQGAKPLLLVTKKNLAQFRAAGLSEY